MQWNRETQVERVPAQKLSRSFLRFFFCIIAGWRLWMGKLEVNSLWIHHFLAQSLVFLLSHVSPMSLSWDTKPERSLSLSLFLFLVALDSLCLCLYLSVALYLFITHAVSLCHTCTYSEKRTHTYKEDSAVQVKLHLRTLLLIKHASLTECRMRLFRDHAGESQINSRLYGCSSSIRFLSSVIVKKEVSTSTCIQLKLHTET